MPQDAKVFIIFWRRLFYGYKYHLKFYLSYLFFCFLLCSLYLIFSVELLLLTLCSLINSTMLIILKSVSQLRIYFSISGLSLWLGCSANIVNPANQFTILPIAPKRYTILKLNKLHCIWGDNWYRKISSREREKVVSGNKGNNCHQRVSLTISCFCLSPASLLLKFLTSSNCIF